MFSSSWSQRGHFSEWSIPLFAKRSTVQHLFSATSQTKNWHLVGAQVLHILSKGSKLIEPQQKPSYADLTENLPFVVNLQKWASCNSCCSLTLLRISHRWRYSMITPTVSARRMSKIHLLPQTPSCTVHLLVLHLEIAVNIRDAMSSTRCPCNHLSHQNKVVTPFPISVCIETEKKAWTLWGIFMGKADHGRVRSIFAIHNHLILSA
jgi:hypothetical protein